jgi:hypothetical protein
MSIGSTSIGDHRAISVIKPDRSSAPALVAWLAIVAIWPLATVIAWQTAYALYAILAGALIGLILANRFPRGQVSAWIVAQTAALVLLFIAHVTERATVINIGSLIFASCVLAGFTAFIPRDTSTIVRLFRWLRLTLLMLVIFGLVLSTALAGPLGLDNPLSDALGGGRVRIFSANYGHSALIDAGIIFLILAGSNLCGDGIIKRSFYAAFGLASVYLAHSSIGYIGALVVLYVYLIESIPLSRYVRNTTHALLVVVLLMAGPALVNDALTSFRSFQVGADQAAQTYRSGDLTAGRAELNAALIDLANAHPIEGDGTESVLLKEGIVDGNGKRVAQGETGIRLAAKFGWFYFGFIVLLILSPLSSLFVDNRPFRITAVSLSLYCLVQFALNSIFEVAHQWATIALLPPIVILASVGWRYRSGAGPRKRLSSRPSVDSQLPARVA